MSGKTRIQDLRRFNVVDYLDSPQAIAQYVTAALEENDSDALIDALETAARARGMSEIAVANALRSDAHPRFETVQRVIAALGLKLTVEPAEAA